MFGFLDMLDNYEDRKVDLYEDNNLFVSTAYVIDGSQQYETAVVHPNYNNGNMIIVEAYNTKEKAQEGHNKWVKTMTSDSLPEKLYDCCNNELSQLLGKLGGELEFEYQEINK